MSNENEIMSKDDSGLNNSLRVRDTAMDVIVGKKWIDYAMSVIVDRALPFVEDGLKPVHRRILWAMHLLDNKHNKPYKKSARIVGDVIGKYHPHGDTAVYNAMVRMAQPFSMRVPLVDGQGNFGSIDGDSPAAMRYTESRMSIFAEKMFSDIEKDTVDMELNYDGTEKMPRVLPLRFPNLLINGSEGIAVAMATSIPCHNPIEVMNAVLYLLDNKMDVSEENIDDLLKIIPAPDFPTGGTVHDLKNMRDAWLHGTGSLKLRANWYSEEDMYGNPKIIITEIPYQVQKEALIKKISVLCSPDKDNGDRVVVEGVKSVQDYSSRKGIHIEIALKKEFDPDSVFAALAKTTDLETSISYNNVVLVDKKPYQLGLLDLLKNFVMHRADVITRRTNFLLTKSKDRQHILIGLVKALSKLDEVIELIKKSSSNAVAKSSLKEFLDVDDIQAESILRMQLRSLTSSEVSDLEAEYAEISLRIKEYEEILGSEDRLYEVIREETMEQIDLFETVRNEKGLNVYSDRLTKTIYARLDNDMAALTKEEESVIYFSENGYVRRVPVEMLQEQNRGTRGKKYMKLSEGDSISKSMHCHSHDQLMFVSNSGQVYSLYAYEIPDSERGRHINNIVETSSDETIKIMIPVDYTVEDDFLILVTDKGRVKKTRLGEYATSFRKGGLRGISIKDGEKIKFARVAKNSDDLVLASSGNKVIRFEISEKSLRSLSRTASGVLGMNTSGDYITDAAVIKNDVEGYLIVVSDKGVSKITKADQYRVQNRSGKGILAMKCNDRTGSLLKVMFVSSLEGDLLITTSKGISNRISVSSLNVTNRVTSGVRLIKLSDGDALVSVDYFDFPSVDSEELIDLEDSLDIA